VSEGIMHFVHKIRAVELGWCFVNLY